MAGGGAGERQVGGMERGCQRRGERGQREGYEGLVRQKPHLCLHDAFHVGRVAKLGGDQGTWGVC